MQPRGNVRHRAAFSTRLHGLQASAAHRHSLRPRVAGVPPLARALCACDVADMDERLYGIRYTLRLDADGHAVLRESRD